tara:strand:+ start:607 stop:2202 length:1596 start_codon:yes stop_codon:yes gene_type:complete
MKKNNSSYQFIVLVYAIMLISGCTSSENSKNTAFKDYQPDRDLGELFVAVQTSKIFDDYKTFVDCSPLKNPTEILNDYRLQKVKQEFNLNDFIKKNFKLPPILEKKEIDTKGDMIAHLKKHWKYLSRTAKSTEQYTTLINLPEPFIVPGGRFRELFYWDSYFSIIGLLESNEDELAFGMLKNFAFLIKKYGFIPNGNRTYFASRSQPPFFGEMLSIYSKKHGIERIMEFLPSLEEEYNFWTINQQKDNNFKRTIKLDDAILNRYVGTLTTPRAEAYGKEKKWAENIPEDERDNYHRHLRAVCESGWDFSSRWFSDEKNKITTNCEDIIPVCLNSLLFGMEKQLSTMYKHAGNKNKVQYYNELSNKRKKAINTYLWSEDSGYFKDYNFVKKENTSILSLATLYPLYFKIASEAQAAQIAKVVETQLLFDGGVVTTTQETGEQWDYPNGWAPLQWITVVGLNNYGYTALASEIANRWLTLNKKVFKLEGKMMEKYNVVDTSLVGGGGEYKNQDGFGWTNGVALGLDAFLKKEE